MSRFESEEGFNIMFSSEDQYERLVAEIYCDGKYVALVHQERGLGDFAIEFPGRGMPNEEAILRSVELGGFLKTVATARRELIDRTT